jgi:hypothetical protein
MYIACIVVIIIGVGFLLHIIASLQTPKTLEGMTGNEQHTIKNWYNVPDVNLYEQSFIGYPTDASTHPPTNWAVDYSKEQLQAAKIYNTRILQLLADNSSKARCRPTITGAFMDCGPYGANIACYNKLI